MKSRRSRIEKAIEDFGNSAEKSSASSAIFKRYNFSLTEQISEDIDNLTMIAKRVSRSDIVKAGIEALKQLPQHKQVALVTQVKQES